MAKARRAFVCRSCGAAQSRWLGKCPDCGTWDALEETVLDPSAGKDPHKPMAAGFGEAAAGPIGGGWDSMTETARQAAIAAAADGPDDESGHGTGGGGGAGYLEAKPLTELVGKGSVPMERLPSGIGELDRVLGTSLIDAKSGTVQSSGLVPGSAVLVGGEPGIGKSTLLLQAAAAWAASGKRVLYVSSEESAEQVALRAKRLRGEDEADDATAKPSKKNAKTDNLFILSDTNLARIIEQARRTVPSVLVIDSVQMIYRADVPAGPGSITQLRRCCAELVYLAKLSGIAVVLVGHVTKDGQLAGPRLLEHLVDVVLTFEGDRYHAVRVVRSVKNRFGTTLEIGLFEMTGRGLREVTEGGGVGVVQMGGESRPGSVVCPVLTGSRCVLVELQALTATGFLGAAKRKSSGLDTNRLAMLIAVLEQHAGLRLADRDVFASSVGGLKVAEPASDLALLLAIAGAQYKRSLPAGTAAIGEVGLGGEVRPVPQLEQRVRECARLGYKRVLVPRTKDAAELAKRMKGEVELVGVKNVDAGIAELT